MTPQMQYRIKYGITPEVEARLWAKIIKRGDDECWGWTGAKDKRGRAKWSPHQRGSQFPHAQVASRIMHGLATGEEPPMVCHTCDNAECTNPRHLYSGDAKTNMRDAVERGRTVKGRRKRPAHERRRIAERYARGEAIGSICEDYGVTISALEGIVQTARKDGITPHMRRATKVSASDVADIVRMRNEGRTLRYIASIYGVHEAHICRVALGRVAPRSPVGADVPRIPRYVAKGRANAPSVYPDVERLHAAIKVYARDNGYIYRALVVRIVVAGVAALEEKANPDTISLDITKVD